jgi:hypothetical protein
MTFQKSPDRRLCEEGWYRTGEKIVFYYYCNNCGKELIKKKLRMYLKINFITSDRASVRWESFWTFGFSKLSFFKKELFYGFES